MARSTSSKKSAKDTSLQDMGRVARGQTTTPLFLGANYRRRGARAYRISLINVHTEPLAVILPAYPPHRPRSRSSRRTIPRIAIPSEQRDVIPSPLSPLSSNFEIRCNDRISLSLSRRWCNLVFELAIFLRMWEGEEHLGAASRHARLVVLFPNGALPRASKRCSTAGCVEGNKKKRRRKEAVEWFEGEERDRDWTTGFAQPAASSFLDIWTRQPLRSAL